MKGIIILSLLILSFSLSSSDDAKVLSTSGVSQLEFIENEQEISSQFSEGSFLETTSDYLKNDEEYKLDLN